MDILICIKQVPGTAKVDMDPNTGVLLRSGVESKLNPYDLYALETGLRLRQAHGGRVCVISMGPAQAEAVIREAYYMGADEGCLICDSCFAGADVLATGYALSQGIAALGRYDLIICGKQTTDGDTAQVGPEVAEFLDIPSVSNVRRILQADNEYITVEMDNQSELIVIKLPLPALITVEKDIYQPRLPSFKKKLEAKDRAVRLLTLSDLSDKDPGHYGINGSPTQVMRIFPPDKSVKQVVWRDSGEALGDALFDELIDKKYIPI